MGNKHQSVGLVIRKNNVCHKLGTIFWGADGSIYLTLQKGKTERQRGFGTFEVDLTQGTWEIPFNAKLDERKSTHSSVHQSGVSHTKVVDGDTVGRAKGMPLKDLANARPLWTIIWCDDETEYTPKATDLVIDEPDRIESRVLYVVAIPLNVGTIEIPTEINDDGTIPDIAPFTFELKDFRLFVMLHYTDRMQRPQQTLKIDAIHGAIPVVTSITDELVQGTLSVPHSGPRG